MANTLKFGNGVWANKKGSTLAYNDENGNFKPLPFTTTRSTSATRVNKEGLIEVVSNELPRIDYTNSEDGVLLLEPTRSNLILKSDDVLTTYQSQNGAVSDANTPINGFNNSIQIDYDASNSLIYKRDFTPTIGTQYTISCFVQMSDNSAPIHTVDVNSGDFCLINNNTLVSESDIKTERLGSTNVYKISAKKTATDTNNRFGIIKYSTQSSKGFKVTGFQLEVGSYATSYIPTQGAISTRSAETASGSGNSEVFNDSEGVLIAEIKPISLDGTYKRITISDGTTTNRIILGFDNINNITATVYNGSNQAVLGGDYTGKDQLSKYALKYKENDFSLWINGFEVAFSTTGVTFQNGTLNQLKFEDGTGTNPFYGKTKQLAYYDTALTDIELETLTSYRSWESMVKELNLNIIHNE